MTEQSQANNQDRSIFEWWYVAHFVLGIIYTGFVPILVPTYVLAVTNSATAIGVVMGILGFGLLLAPSIGNFADRFRAYRVTQLGGLLALALGSALFTIIQQELVFALAALLLGIGIATLMTLDSTFIVGTRQPQALEARRLTVLNQSMIIGQLVGSFVIAALTRAGWSFQARFLVMTSIAVIGFIVTAITNQKAAARIQVSRQNILEKSKLSQTKVSTLLLSPFGLFLLSAVFNTIGQQAIWGQYPNYMQKVFQIDPALSATALSVAAVFTLIALSLGGQWMASSGPESLYLMALTLRLIAAGGLILLASMGSVIPFLPLAMYVVFILGIGWIDLTSPELAARKSTTTTAATQGFLLSALAIGSILGNLLGGWAAETFGFQILPQLAANAIFISILFAFLAIRRHRI